MIGIALVAAAPSTRRPTPVAGSRWTRRFKVRTDHAVLIAVTGGLNVAWVTTACVLLPPAAHPLVGAFHGAVVGWWLVVPCHDRQFGQGQPFHYVRQTVFAAFGLLCALLGLGF